MKLLKARVENFKCIEDSTEFSINQVTCLVGKNESGKTALLEALYKLKPVEADKADFDEEEFPRRHLATYRERREREPANVLSTTWELDVDDVAAVEERIGPGSLASREVVVTKGYDNITHWALELEEKRVVDQFLGEAKLNAAEKAPLAKAASIQDLVDKIEAIDSPTEKHTALLNAVRSSFPEGDAKTVAQSILAERLPYFVYFSTYHQLPGRVGLNDLKRRRGENNLKFEHKVFLSLLEMTSTGLEEIERIDQLEKLVMELESIEATLTEEIKRYWSQNRHLEIRFRYDYAKPSDPPPLNEGFVFNTRIYNTRHRATVSFENRSHGFIWFFSFLVWFSQAKRQYGDDLILLLDEPGLPLHGRAQQDLIRYINERLRPHHQVIYTAHSPFLIDVENIFSLRTMEDVVKVSRQDGETVEEVLGTKVGQRILSRDRDTIFPLQGILGFDMAQTLFVGPYVVVVEGPTERAVFEWFSRQLAKRGEEDLDLRWAVCPAEGASKISSFVTLFAGRGLKIAVFADYHEGQKRMIDHLEESGLLQPGHLLRTSTFADAEESDIEDLIGRELYVELVNRCLGLTGSHRLPSSKPDGAEERVVKEVEAHCRVLPPAYPEFDHYNPIEYLFTLSDEEVGGLPGLDKALERFRRVFRKLNSLIDPDEDAI
jgi:predicted ATP-dependent endonuclease of OLD family